MLGFSMRSVSNPMTEFEDLLDALTVAPGDTVLLHSSYGRVRDMVASPEDLIKRLINRLGADGTLFVPRYAWHLYPEQRPWMGYAEFLRMRPVIDIRSTPANRRRALIFLTSSSTARSVSAIEQVCIIASHSQPGAMPGRGGNRFRGLHDE